MHSTGIDTVILDMDGVIFDTEEIWHEARRDYAVKHGGHWTEEDQRAVMGDNSAQWAAYMQTHCGVKRAPEDIYAGVVKELRDTYAQDLPLIPGSREAIAGLAARYRLGLASSSPLGLIEYALELADLRAHFTSLVSSDEVPRGKPAPDVYLKACSRLETVPEKAAAVEDSTSGLQAAAAAGLAVIAIPNPAFPPSAEALALADVILAQIVDLVPAVVESLSARAHPSSAR
jgi:HAD superfamily hydrolase (TIGR01509 family)